MDGRVSLMGVMQSELLVAAFPAFIPKLGYFAMITVPLDMAVESLTLRLKLPGSEEPISDTDVPAERLEEMQTAKPNAATHAKKQLGIHGVQIPVPILAAGTIEFEAILNGRSFTLATLGVRAPENDAERVRVGGSPQGGA